MAEIRHAVEQNGKDCQFGDGYWEAAGAQIAKELLAHIDELESQLDAIDQQGIEGNTADY